MNAIELKLQSQFIKSLLSKSKEENSEIYTKDIHVIACDADNDIFWVRVKSSGREVEIDFKNGTFQLDPFSWIQRTPEKFDDIRTINYLGRPCLSFVKDGGCLMITV